MKKILIPLFSLVLVFVLLFSATTTAAAVPPPPPPPPPIPLTPSLPEPVVTPVSGDMEFTTEFIPIAQFPGTTEFNQMLVPVGFPAGEAQYQGDGVIVTGMDSGKATVCFTITGTEYGWGGKVGLWDGTKWVKLATTITPIEESNKSLACAPITGNGTYAFIRYVTDASLLPTPSCPAMVTEFWYFNPNDEYELSIRFPSDHPAVGTPVTYEVVDYSPNGSLWGDFSGTVLHGTWGTAFTDFVDLMVEPKTLDYAIVHVQFPGCSVDLTWNSASPIQGTFGPGGPD